MDGENFHENRQRNVLGGRLQSCSTAPMTGFFEMAVAIPARKMLAATPYVLL